MNWHEAWGVSEAEFERLQEAGRMASAINYEIQARAAERAARRLEKRLGRMIAAVAAEGATAG